MPSDQAYAVRAETFESIASLWLDSRHSLEWNCFFVLPPWLKAWWDSFGGDLTPYLCSVRQGETPIGIAPMVLRGDRVSFMGSPEVCDYLDFILAPGREWEFFEQFIAHLRHQGVTHLDLGPVRHDSTVIATLSRVAKSLGCEFSSCQEDVSLEVDLPATWEEFLSALAAKERHEVRRKLRRLDEAGSVHLRVLETAPEIGGAMDLFFKLFRSSRPEKAAFMTAPMAAFFRSLAETMANLKMLKLSFLDLNGTSAAVTLCFDYRSTVYLYNSGYDPQFRPLSAGLLCKVLGIRDSIQRGREKYDFLKGAETYKYRLRGKSIPLYRCAVALQ
jgi:CelD/BcsL family acetyltransferase involved in cellulose biosynthesis